MFDVQDMFTPLPAASAGAAARPLADDWLAVSEQDLSEAHAEACALFTGAARGSAVRVRHARSAVLLEQLLAARAVQRARHVRPDAARAAMRGDHALGYFFGLAAGVEDPAAPPPSERALAAALRHVHGLVFGMREAHRLADSDLIEVGEAFGDGLLSAEADLQAFLAHGPSAVATGLLAALPWLRCSGAACVARPA